MTSEHTTSGRGATVRPCRVVCLRAHDEELTVLLEADGRDVPVHVRLPAASRTMLSHVAALHGHAPGCRSGARDVHVGLLIRSLQAVGSRPSSVIVRPGPAPSFWLRVVRQDGPVDIDLGVLDAAALLMSGRLPVVVDLTAGDPWETALEDLLGGGPSSC